MSLNRRDFLRNAALASAGLVAPACAGAWPGSGSSEWILGGGRYMLPEAPTVPRHVLSLVDLSGSARRTVELGFLPHAAVLDPTNPERVVTFEKIGPGAADVDLASMTRTRPIAPAPGRWFYGHGAFSPDRAASPSPRTAAPSG